MGHSYLNSYGLFQMWYSYDSEVNFHISVQQTIFENITKNKYNCNLFKKSAIFIIKLVKTQWLK